MKIHPAAEAFPMLSGLELQSLAADIQTHGQREPIVVYRGELLDGRNRLRACEMIGVEPDVVHLDAEVHSAGGPVAFVVSRNLRRRHLDESQRAIVAAKLATLPKGANQHASIEAPSQVDAAKMLNVGRASVQRAREVLDKGAEPLVRAVERGDVAVSTAAAIARAHTEDEQKQIVAAGERAILDEAKRLREEREDQPNDPDDEDDGPPDVLEGEDPPRDLSTEKPLRLGDFGIGSVVVRVIGEWRATRERVDAILAEAHQDEREEIARRLESAALTHFEWVRSLLPITAKRVEDNRAGFRAIDGGQKK